MPFLKSTRFMKYLLLRKYYKLAEVGILEQAKQQGNYDIGQLFLHHVFGYRGIILCPWQAKIFDRDMITSHNKDNLNATSVKQTNMNENFVSENSNTKINENTVLTNKTHYQEEYNEEINLHNLKNFDYNKILKGYPQTYYQVLIDARDSPFIGHQSESVTFLGGHQNSRGSLYAIPGLDYVSHEDVMPYTTTEENPFSHELFHRFISYDPDKNPRFKPKETLKIWQEKNFSWLQLSEVHRETTEGVRITLIPFYMGTRESNNVAIYWWRYCIRLENLMANKYSIQLRERHWRIFSLAGTLETVRGRGVVGQEPILSKEFPAFQYSSHVSLQSPSGHMWGTFKMEREDGYVFDCKIPPFPLEGNKIYEQTF